MSYYIFINGKITIFPTIVKARKTAVGKFDLSGWFSNTKEYQSETVYDDRTHNAVGYAGFISSGKRVLYYHDLKEGYYYLRLDGTLNGRLDRYDKSYVLEKESEL